MIIIKNNSKVRQFTRELPEVDTSSSTQSSVIDLNNITNTVYKCGIELEGFFARSGRTRKPVGFKDDCSVSHSGDSRFQDYFDSESIRERDYISNSGNYYHGEVVREPKTITEAYRFMNSAYPARTNSSCGMHVHISLNNPLDQIWLLENDFEKYLLKVLKVWSDRNLGGDAYNRSLLYHRLNGAYYCQPMKELEFSYLRENDSLLGNENYKLEKLKIPSTHCHLESQGNYRVGAVAPNVHQRWNGEHKYLITNPDLYKFGSLQGFQKNQLGTIEFRVLPAFDSKQLAVKIYTELMGAVIKYLSSEYIKDKTEHLRSEREFSIIRRSKMIQRPVVTTI